MDEVFIVPVTYRGKPYEFETRIKNWGYTYRIEVDVDGTKILFEPDEERNYRALLNEGLTESSASLPDKGLLEAIAQQLESLHN